MYNSSKCFKKSTKIPDVLDIHQIIESESFLIDTNMKQKYSDKN